MLMVTIISMSAACGIALFPFLSPSFYDRTLIYFVALGVGTLSGSAMFNLIPEVMIIQPTTLLKVLTLLSTKKFFFIRFFLEEKFEFKS